MNRGVLAAVGLAVLAALAWLLLAPGGGTVRPGGGGPEDERGEQRVPELAPGARPDAPRGKTPEEEAAERETAPPPRAEPDAGPAITGVVLDDETGKPMAGVTVAAEIADATCPRLPAARVFWQVDAENPLVGGPGRGGPFFKPASGPTDEAGAFSIPWNLAGVGGDVFARKTGWVLACECKASPGTPLTIRLKKGSEIRGVVVRGDGRAVSGALVTCRPAPGTPLLPGHADMARTDDEGRFALTGLVPGAVIVTADHPKFVATTLEPMEPGRKDLRIVLVPAFLASFEITTDDAKEPDAPSLAWKTTGVPPRSDLLLLQKHDWGVELATPPLLQGATRYEPVRVPCDRPDVSFELKAIGYETWSAGPEPLPVDGAEKTYPVLLRRDASLGVLRLLFEDREGKPVSFLAAKGEASTMRRDRQPVPGGVVMKPGDLLEYPALPHGPYLILVRSPLHAPALVSVDVPAGRTTEQKVVLGPPAKLRVRFTAPEATIVRFRLLLGKDPVYPFPESTTVAQETGDDAKTDPVLHAGAEGIVLSGLAAGRYGFEVLNPDLVAPPTAVDAVEGETREVEVALQRR